MTPSTKSLRAIAGFEALKGVLAVLAGGGLLLVGGRNLQGGMELLLARCHINLAWQGAKTLMAATEAVGHWNGGWVAVGVCAYASLRFSESYGLWRNRVWAEWIGVISGAIYLPLEIWDLSQRFPFAIRVMPPDCPHRAQRRRLVRLAPPVFVDFPRAATSRSSA